MTVKKAASVAKKGITVSKRTSIGGKHTPLNKHKRRSWKRYVGQGRR